MAPLFCTKWGCGCFSHFWHINWLNHSKCFHLTVKIIPPQICQKDQSRPVQDWSLIPAQNVRTRTNAVWFWAGPGLQSSPVLSLSSVLGPDLQTLAVIRFWQLSLWQRNEARLLLSNLCLACSHGCLVLISWMAYSPQWCKVFCVEIKDLMGGHHWITWIWAMIPIKNPPESNRWVVWLVIHEKDWAFWCDSEHERVLCQT